MALAFAGALFIETLPVVIRPDPITSALCTEWRPMAEVETRFAVFCGKVDQKRESGWYWTVVPQPGEPLKGPFTGPFETKDEAIEHALRSGAGRLH